MKAKKFIAFVFILALRSISCFANTYYVATNGNDSDPGTLTSPFATLQRGVNAAVAGDSIIVQNGIYGCSGGSGSMAVNINTAGTALAPIVLKSATKWGAILDGQMTCHSYINFQVNSAWWIIQDFDITNTHDGGIWSNSNGGKNISIKGNHIHHIGNRPNSTTIGEAGIYSDQGSIMIISGNVINDVGRTDKTASNGFDHGIYTHGTMTIVNNIFYRSLAGHHIQTAVGFSGLIANNTFVGPDMWNNTKDGQIVLWDAAGGPINIRNNIFSQSYLYAVVSSSFTPNGGCNIDHNITTVASIYDNSNATLSSNSVNTDPLLMNSSLTSPDAHLQPGSPAIDAGINLSPTVIDDFDGTSRPQGAGYDMGAYEHHTLPAGCLTGSTVWQNGQSFSIQTGSFRVTFDATPNTNLMNGLTGFATNLAADYTDLAAIIRFSPSGNIDVRNDSIYQADSSIAYTAGTTYNFRLEINVANHTYDAYITPPSGPEIAIAINYAFRTEQAIATNISYWNVHADIGTHTVCNVVVSTTTDIYEINPASGFVIYPNPNNGIFTVKNLYPNAIISVVTVLGENVFSRSLNNEYTEIDLSHWPTGIYLLKCNSGEKLFIQKLTIQK